MHVLITGTTSGIGRGLLRHYYGNNRQVTAVNRSPTEDQKKEFPRATFLTVDVRDKEGVVDLLRSMEVKSAIPDIWILNAGINKVDNDNHFDLDTFTEVMDINFMGVMNFIGEAIRFSAIKPIKVVTISSLSIFYPNVNSLGYHLSKLSTYHAFKLLSRRYRASRVKFKIMVLGPVKTSIAVSARGVTAFLWKTLAREERDVVPEVVRFLEDNRNIRFYPKGVSLLFYVASIMRRLLYPFLGSGRKHGSGGNYGAPDL